MPELIPENIRSRIEAFTSDGMTGQIVLNVYHGAIVSADIREHLKSAAKNVLDKVKPAD